MSRKWLLGLLVVSTLYLIIGLIYYTSETTVLDGFPVFATIYLALITIHGVAYGLGLVISWLGLCFHKSGAVTLGSILKIIAGILFFPSLLVIIPLVILILIFNKKDVKREA